MLVTVSLLAVGGALLLWSGARPIGLVALAGVGGLLASAGALRTVVGAILVGLGLFGGLVAVTNAEGLATGRGQTAAAIGGLTVLAAGVLVVTFGRRWTWSRGRYERETAATADRPSRSDSSLELWRALDRGEDPTVAVDGETDHEAEVSVDDADERGR